MRRYGVALCLHDMESASTGQQRVGPFVYVRFHGPRRYSGRYADEYLSGWAEWLRQQVTTGVPVYAYFNNDVGGDAPRDALRLRHMMDHEIHVAVRNPLLS